MEDLQYLITCGGQRVLQVSHIAQVTSFFVLITVVTDPLVTLVISTRHSPSTCRKTSFSFVNGTFLFSSQFVVSETRVTSKVSVAIRTGDSIARE